MTVPSLERRQPVIGGVVCENGVLRLRVVREFASLGLVIDARDNTGRWTPMVATPVGADLHRIDVRGEYQAAVYRTFEPLETRGQTHGVVLHGAMGRAHVTHTCTLGTASTWCHHRVEVTGIAADPLLRLTHTWMLEREAEVDIWPATPVRGAALVGSPAAFMSGRDVFIALAPDLEEGDVPRMGLQVNPDEGPSVEFGIMADTPYTPGDTVRLAYAMCLDGHPLANRGFQQVVRLLGGQPAMRLASVDDLTPVDIPLPPLPALPADAVLWDPFRREGTIPELAAQAWQFLTKAEHDWRALDDGLCWLDRLALHQCVYELPGFPQLGALVGAEDTAAACWMPSLFWEAFRLTGIPEYAHRGIAALAALPEPARGAAYHALRARFGDIYVHADYREAVSLTGVTITHSYFGAEDVELAVACEGGARRLRLVMDGVEPAYRLTINHETLGTLSTDRLRKGVEFPAPAIA
jgi:hypothetical protein